MYGGNRNKQRQQEVGRDSVVGMGTRIVDPLLDPETVKNTRRAARLAESLSARFGQKSESCRNIALPFARSLHCVCEATLRNVVAGSEDVVPLATVTQLF
jgi:hypothetical protein